MLQSEKKEKLNKTLLLKMFIIPDHSFTNDDYDNIKIRNI